MENQIETMQKGKKVNLVVLIAIFCLDRIILFTSYQMVNPFINNISQSLNTTIVFIGLILAIRSAMGFFGPFWGTVADLLGNKKGVLVGLGVFALSMFAIWLLPVLPCFTIAVPVSYAAILIHDAAMYAYLSNIVPYKRRGKMVAILESSYALAFMLGTPVSGYLIKYFSWVAPFQLSGIITVAFFLIIWFVLPNEPPVRCQDRGTSEKMGYFASIKAVVKDGHALCALLTCFLLCGGNWMVQSIYGAWLSDTFKMDVEKIGWLSSLFGFAVFLGAMLNLLFTDRLGKTKSMIVGTALTTVSGVAVLIVGTNNLILDSVFLFAFFALIEFATEANIALSTEVNQNIRATFVSTSFGCLALGSTLGNSLSPSVYLGKGFYLCVIISLVLLILGIIVTGKMLSPVYGKEKTVKTA